MPKRPTETSPAGEAAPSPAIPPVLGSPKPVVDALLGRPVMARSLLGKAASGEKAYAYSQAGDDIIVGFLGDVARYLAVVRKSGPKAGFSPAETSSILALNAPASKWKSEKSALRPTTPAKGSKTPRKTISPEVPSTYYSLSDASRDIVGWQPGDKPFLFFLLPSFPGQPHLLLNEWQVARSIG